MIQLFMRLLFISVVLGSTSAFGEIVKNKFKDPDSGFAISKPAEWEFVASPKAKGIQLKDDTVMNAANRTIVAFSKNLGKDFFGVKPTVGVEKLKLRGKATALEWLAEELKKQAEHDKHFVQASAALVTTIDEVNDAARAAFVNSTIVNGREVRVYHVIYAVPSGGRVFMINMNCNEDLANQYVDVFGKIADSIEARK